MDSLPGYFGIVHGRVARALLMARPSEDNDVQVLLQLLKCTTRQADAIPGVSFSNRSRWGLFASNRRMRSSGTRSTRYPILHMCFPSQWTTTQKQTYWCVTSRAKEGNRRPYKDIIFP